MTAYPVAGKQKSRDICMAFIRGCGGQLANAYRSGPAFFYGVDESNLAIWQRVRASGDDWYYCDNSLFDSRRQASFRVARNRLQHSGFGSTNGKRFAALGIAINPWRVAGEHIVVCPQSDHFMHTIAGYHGDWKADVVAHLQASSQRPVRVREWSPDKGKLSATLEQDLEGAHALITWSSAAAVTAILNGVPAVSQSCDSAAMAMLRSSPSEFESIEMHDDRLHWASVLADQEWSLTEFENGIAWRMLHGF